MNWFHTKQSVAGTSVSSHAALIVPNRVVAVRAVLKLSLRSATSPLALSTPSACDTTCIVALTRLLCTLWCCNVFVLARHLMHAQHRHRRWNGFTISSRQSAKCAPISVRGREDETGARATVNPAAAVWCSVSILVAGYSVTGWDLLCDTGGWGALTRVS